MHKSYEYKQHSHLKVHFLGFYWYIVLVFLHITFFWWLFLCFFSGFVLSIKFCVFLYPFCFFQNIFFGSYEPINSISISKYLFRFYSISKWARTGPHYRSYTVSTLWKLWSKMSTLWSKIWKNVFYKQVSEFYFPPIPTWEYAIFLKIYINAAP